MIKNLDLVKKIDAELNASKCHGGLLDIIGFVEGSQTTRVITLDNIEYEVDRVPYIGQIPTTVKIIGRALDNCSIDNSDCYENVTFYIFTDKEICLTFKSREIKKIWRNIELQNISSKVSVDIIDPICTRKYEGLLNKYPQSFLNKCSNVLLDKLLSEYKSTDDVGLS